MRKQLEGSNLRTVTGGDIKDLLTESRNFLLGFYLKMPSTSN